MKMIVKLVMALVSIAGIVSLTYLNVSSDFSEDVYKKGETIQKISCYLREKNERLTDEELTGIASSMYNVSRLYDVDYRLVLAIMGVESNFRHDAVSERGAIGIMQVRPVVARTFARDVGIRYESQNELYDPNKNVLFGIYYLAWLNRYFDDLNVVLHAYNVGHNRARRALERDTEIETPYTNRVMREYQKTVALFPEV